MERILGRLDEHRWNVLDYLYMPGHMAWCQPNITFDSEKNMISCRLCSNTPQSFQHEVQGVELILLLHGLALVSVRV